MNFAVAVKMGKVTALMLKLQQMEGFRRGTKTAFVHLKSKIAIYPPRSSRPQAHLWTPLQRRAFFAKLRSGEIEVPYVRGSSPNSERLAQRWIVEGEGYGLKLHNRASYAGLVQGQRQTAYHKQTGWKNVPDVIEEERSAMLQIIMGEIKKDLA